MALRILRTFSCINLSSIDEQINENDKSNECMDLWKYVYKGEEILQKTKCLYLSLTVIRNAKMNIDGKIENTELLAVFKFGHCEVKKSNVYKRLYDQFTELGAVYVVPIQCVEGCKKYITF